MGKQSQLLLQPTKVELGLQVGEEFDNTEVLKEHSVDGAAEKFETMFKKVLDNHAPERKIQMRSNYQPFISEETKILITERRRLQQRAISSGCRELKKEFNRKN